MGNTCNTDSSIQLHEVTHLPLLIQQSKQLSKKITLSERFRQQVQKLKLQGQNMYRLILPVEGQRQQTRQLDMKFLFSYADMQLCPQYKFTIQDMTHFPIIDTFQSIKQEKNPQIYHKIRTLQKRKKTMKYYNFRTLNDYEFKKGLYEISLYKRLQHSHNNDERHYVNRDGKNDYNNISSHRPLLLEDYFVIYKGQIKQLVMIFPYSYVSLHDVLYYRQMAAYQWTEMELLLLMNMLCEALIEMKRVNIVHRDIRPSKVFFQPVSGGLLAGDNQQSIIRNDKNNQHFFRFYTLKNLQSARVYEPQYGHNPNINEQQAMHNHEIDVDLLTVKGVSTFTDSPVKQALQRQQHKANYNPFKNDIHSLKNTLISLINLQPTNTASQHVIEQRLTHKGKLKQLLKFISLPGVTVQQLNEKILLLIGVTSIIKPKYFYTLLRDFYTKELTICQNIQANLYFNSNTFAKSSLALDSDIGLLSSGMIFSNNNLQSQGSLNLPQQQQQNQSSYPVTGKQFIQDLYIRALYDLHKKDIFVPYMLDKLAKNFQLNKKQENIKLLLKVGKYFQQAGIKENQYYKEAILLLLEIAHQQRLQGFYKDHQRLITATEQIMGKFHSESKMILRARCGLLKQKAYKQLLILNNNQMPELLLNMRQSFHQNAQMYPIVQGLINQAYELALRANLQFEQQLELIYSKGELYYLMNRIQQSETAYLTGYQLAEKNYKEFLTVHNCTKYKGMFEFGLGMVQLLKLKTRMVEKSPKLLFSLMNRLNNAKQRFSSISIHPVYVIKCYFAMGDLALLKEDSQQAIANFQKALNLLHAANSQQLNRQRSISAQIQLSIVHQIINTPQYNTQMDMAKYQRLYEVLGKETNKERSRQKRYSRKGRVIDGSNLKSRQSEQSIQGNKQPGMFKNNGEMVLPVIRQQQEENKMFQSQRINGAIVQSMAIHNEPQMKLDGQQQQQKFFV